MKAVKARKDSVVATFRDGLERSLETLQGCAVYKGHCRFVAEKKVAVNGSELTADQIFINVGARASIPAIPGLDQVPYLTNSSMMDIDFLPAHLVILGGSYIGLEFAQIYRRFGSEVTVIEFGPRLISREDEDVSHAIAGFLKEEGIDVRVEAKTVSVEKQGNMIAVKIESAGNISQISGTHLLVATGRRPNTDDFGVDRAGIRTDTRGYIQVDDQLRTNIPGIWAMGDCNGRGAFTHTSWNDFEIVAANLLDNDQRRVSDRITAYSLYTDPPLGRAGLTEAEVRETRVGLH
jgi:pyruvate/2-oxoglutarate dehydrogenase complex dihydrolipoamide dehydrogenase (E3) component